MLSKYNKNGRQLVYCDYEINSGNSVFLNISSQAAISDKGDVIFINSHSAKNSPTSLILSISLLDGKKASSIAFVENIILAANDLKYTAVLKLGGEEIIAGILVFVKNCGVEVVNFIQCCEIGR